jgi:hypothetical protein
MRKLTLAIIVIVAIGAILVTNEKRIRSVLNISVIKEEEGPYFEVTDPGVCDSAMGTIMFYDAGEDAKANCYQHLAYNLKDPKWCSKISTPHADYNFVEQAACIGGAAKALNNPDLCENIIEFAAHAGKLYSQYQIQSCEERIIKDPSNRGPLDKAVSLVIGNEQAAFSACREYKFRSLQDNCFKEIGHLVMKSSSNGDYQNGVSLRTKQCVQNFLPDRFLSCLASGNLDVPDPNSISALRALLKENKQAREIYCNFFKASSGRVVPYTDEIGGARTPLRKAFCPKPD